MTTGFFYRHHVLLRTKYSENAKSTVKRGAGGGVKKLTLLFEDSLFLRWNTNRTDFDEEVIIVQTVSPFVSN